MSLTYTVSIPQLPALQRAFAQAPAITKRAVSTAINQSLVGYQGTAKRLAPIDKGTLRGSIQTIPAAWSGNQAQGSVGTNLGYAIYQEQGTGIYGPYHTPITPKTKPTLAWYSGGRWHFAKQVRGVTPKWFMRTALEQNQARTEGYFQLALDHVAAEIAGGIR